MTSVTSKKPFHWLAAFCFGLAMLFLLLLYFQVKINIGIFLNADALFFPLFLKTLFLQKFSYSSWYMSTGLYIFPDILLVMISLLITGGNIFYMNAVAIFLQLLLAFIAVSWFNSTFLSLRKALLIAAFVILLFVNIAIAHNSTFLIFLSYGQHFALIFIILLILALFHKSLSVINLNWFSVAVVFIVCVLCSLSDPLFLAWCILPLLATCTLLWLYHCISSRNYLFLLSTLIFSTYFGILLARILIVHPTTFHPKLLLTAIPVNVKLIWQLFKALTILDQSFVIISLMTSIALFFIFIFNLIKYKHSLITHRTKSTLFLLGYHAFLLVLLSCFFITITNDSIAIRFVLILFIVPYIVGFIYLFKNLNIKGVNFLEILLGLFIILFTLIMAFRVFVPWTGIITSFVPEPYQCIYTNLAKYNAKHGIASYWIAKPLIAFSNDSQLNVAAFVPPLQPYLWLTTSNWLHPNYDFAIYSNLDPTIYNKEVLFQINGQPDHEAQCGPFQVLIYDTKKLHQQ